jgi:hypothetical protein
MVGQILAVLVGQGQGHVMLYHLWPINVSITSSSRPWRRRSLGSDLPSRCCVGGNTREVETVGIAESSIIRRLRSGYASLGLGYPR